MLKILVVEDSKEKIERIKDLLSTFDQLKSEDITVVSSQISCKRELQIVQYDLVILDICLPNRDNEPPQEDGGVRLLREIHSRSIFQKPHCIVGLTAYPDQFDSAGAFFSGFLWSVILYQDNSDSWQHMISRRIEYLIDLNVCADKGRTFKYDLGVITALMDPEFSALEKLTNWKRETATGDSTHYYSGVFSSGTKRVSVITACLPQMGMPAAAVTSTKMISGFTPRYFAMTGITAGVRGKVDLGDVIVADPCWDWGSGKLMNGILHPDPMQCRLDGHTRTMFLDAQRNRRLLNDVWDNWPGKKPAKPPTLHIGPCVSGASVLAQERSVKDILKHNRKLIGIDMEVYGFMHASAYSTLPHPLAFSMKGVSDFADEEKDDSYREYSAYVSVELLRRIALEYF